MKIIIVVLCLCFSSLMQAQRITCDTSSCVKKKAGNYQIQVVKKCSDRLNIYVNHTGDTLLVNESILGYVDYFFKDHTYVVEDFYRYPNTNYFEAEIPSTDFYDFKITLVIKGQTVEVYFENECTLKALADY